MEGMRERRRGPEESERETDRQTDRETDILSEGRKRQKNTETSEKTYENTMFWHCCVHIVNLSPDRYLCSHAECKLRI